MITGSFFHLAADTAWSHFDWSSRAAWIWGSHLVALLTFWHVYIGSVHPDHSQPVVFVRRFLRQPGHRCTVWIGSDQRFFDHVSGDQSLWIAIFAGSEVGHRAGQGSAFGVEQHCYSIDSTAHVHRLFISPALANSPGRPGGMVKPSGEHSPATSIRRLT